MNQSVNNGKLFLLCLFFLETLVVFCLLFSAVPLCSQQQTHATQTSPLTDEQKFQQVEDRWSEAIDKRDEYVLELVLSPALIDISATGDVTTRNQQISMLFQKGTEPRALDQRVVRVRILANIAVVTGNYTEQLRVNDKAVQQKGVFTHVYQNVRGNWLCVVSHRTATGECARVEEAELIQQTTSARGQWFQRYTGSCIDTSEFNPFHRCSRIGRNYASTYSESRCSRTYWGKHDRADEYPLHD